MSAEAGPSREGGVDIIRKVRVRKLRGQPSPAQQSPDVQDAMDRRIAEIIPGLAELSVSGSDRDGTLSAARAVRQQRLQRELRLADELRELRDIYDFSVPNPVDDQAPSGPWKQQLRAKPRKIVLSPYQYEMINYQRMLLRKNIWYYRDRMSVPRGPCPLHVLKDAWVQGVVDENTLVWGHGLYDWLPAKNVKLLLPMIRTPEVRFGAWFKRTFSLKPALERIRDRRKDARNPELLSPQVERMR
ncbi:hypothetical protein MNEG_2158 [Monoraphidium neglectum]|uniref:GYF domain-containing protein n=1 Tax=Monoraphidium neglectum TaxID=145388 RepID=A0A0D2LH31_9CHLO|nr:hypothetical protein MNEG_2158 [Monoraphidium neglectum]KIZ05804.1 hypothetical protein MNEG_2158 [Monoraphidium neglectum]|eukprot:XP_013904823.1 hypothetical protein MNEG_2158 [Monoraphidium neglectum]